MTAKESESNQLWKQYQFHKEWWINAVNEGKVTQKEWNDYAPKLLTRYLQAGMIVPQ